VLQYMLGLAQLGHDVYLALQRHFEK
jgi:hypothetical protein